MSEEGGHHYVAGVGQQRTVGQGAGRHDARYRSFHGAFVRDLADLLANHRRFAHFHQLGKIRLQRMEGYAGHLDRRARRLATRCEGNAEQPRRLYGIVKKQFVEITHAVEDQHVGVLRLDAQILLHHWGVIFQAVLCGRSVFGLLQETAFRTLRCAQVFNAI